MPVGYHDSTTLIAAVKRKASIPSAQQTFGDTDFLAFANEEIQTALVPAIMAVNEEYFVYQHVDVSLVASTSNYIIPYRAIGGKLRNIFYEDTNGNLTPLTRIDPAEKSYYQDGTLNSQFVTFYVQGNDVVLVPNVSSSPTGSLVFEYFLRPNDLVVNTRGAKITAINTSGSDTIYTVDRVPYSSGTTYMAITDYLDIIQAKPGHKTRKFDLNATAIDTSAKTITFVTANLPSGVEVGDYINFAGETCIPQIPSDLHHVLTERVAARCLEALGDNAGLQAANQKIAELEVKSNILIDSRVEGSPLKVVNRKGLLASGKLRR